MTNKVNPWDLDIRVRERNLKNGTLTDKDVEKLHSSLPDQASLAEPVSVPQPALVREDEDEAEDNEAGDS